eukprot:CAMPEP_0196571718 /NCGR_PEP_ID=MMETSP1081-20130531/1844_1 /TAXON_ID=36882 /ORGANISM="Pyramimonas amylifera, Strain CCMP720" /LENGTH=434 /DNA_ID=CAMNT_0041888759 /DNA_START=318 /DNA_END=1622 /DNA_ORIENTATION=-
MTVAVTAGVVGALVSSLSAVVYSVISARRKQGDPEVVMAETEFNRSVLSKCPSLTRTYSPAAGVTNPHFETIFAALFRSEPNVTYFREVVPMKGGGVVSIDSELDQGRRGSELSVTAPILLLLPGLTGGSQDAYVKHMFVDARKQGFRPIVMNSRGCGDGPVTSAQFYSASFTEDVRSIVNLHRRRYPAAAIMGVGWSLGANILVNYVGEEGEACPLTSAVSLCNPFDLVLCNKAFEKGFSRLYDFKLARKLSSIMGQHRMLFEGMEDMGFDVAGSVKCDTIREFDDRITRISFGFPSVDAYYKASGSANKVHNVAIPLLCIQAADDPISVNEAIPREEIKQNPNCVLINTPGGGHLGWTAGEEGVLNRPWTDRGVIEFLNLTKTLIKQREMQPLLPMVEVLETDFKLEVKSSTQTMLEDCENEAEAAVKSQRN